MIVTDSIIRGAEEIYRDFECAKLRAYQTRPENPNRIGFEKFGSAVATLGPGVAYFNRVLSGMPGGTVTISPRHFLRLESVQD